MDDVEVEAVDLRRGEVLGPDAHRARVVVEPYPPVGVHDGDLEVLHYLRHAPLRAKQPEESGRVLGAHEDLGELVLPKLDGALGLEYLRSQYRVLWRARSAKRGNSTSVDAGVTETVKSLRGLLVPHRRLEPNPFSVFFMASPTGGQIAP